MFQANTNTGNGNTNQCHDVGRGGQSKGGLYGQCRGDCNGNHRNNSIAKYSFEGKMKDGLSS